MSLLGFEYTQHILAQVRDRLALRLNDPDNCFWSADELDNYLLESLDAWNLYARYFSVRATGTLTSGAHELDLSSLVTSKLNPVVGDTTDAPLSYSVSGQKILISCLLHLLETRNTTLTSHTPTGHIDSDLLVNYISLAVNQFIQESFCYVNKREYPITAEALSDANGRYTLDENINNLVHVEHITLEGNIRTLRRVDIAQARNMSRTMWNAPGRPEYYALSTTSPLAMYLLPWPNDIATIRLYTVEHTAGTEDLFTVDENFTFPYEFWPAVKYLTLYKIYSTDGPTHYPQMADYCMQRYKEYVTLAREYSPLNFSWIEETPCYVSPFSEIDNMYPSWRNKSSVDLDSGGKLTNEISILSPNLLVSHKKYSRDVSFSFDLIRNVPTFRATDGFPVGEDYLPYILDYAEHLATIKSGGAEFQSTLSLYDNFLVGAMRLNDKLAAGLARLKPKSQGQYKQHQSTQEYDRQEAKVEVNSSARGKG